MAAPLEARLELLEAAEAVRELVGRYALTIDSKAGIEAVADLFTDDAVLLNHERFEGREVVMEYYAGVLTALEASRHHVTGSTVACDGPRRAHHRGTFLAIIQRDGQRSLLSGDYEDVAVRCDDGVWRFAVKGNYVKLVQPLPPLE